MLSVRAPSSPHSGRSGHTVPLTWPARTRTGFSTRTADAPAAPLPGEMLVMTHFRPGLLEGMLQGFRAAHIPPVALKAMLTDTNAAWTAPALYAEIAKEHAAMHSGGRAHKA